MTATVQAGGSGTVSFFNSNVGTLVVNKVATFNFTSIPALGTTGACFISTTGGTGSITFENLAQGSYSITESGQTGWTITSTNPQSAAITAGTTTTITFTNVQAQQVGNLQINKETEGGDTGTFDFVVSQLVLL